MHRSFLAVTVAIALGAALLIAPARAASSAAPLSQTDDAGAAPVQATPVQYTVPLGQTGFGWG